MAEIKAEEYLDIRRKLLKPALTSHYIVDIPMPKNGFLKNRVGAYDNFDKLTIPCLEASLPGSSLATIDIDNDYSGVTEKHGYRRIYDDRIDFTFLVDSESYYSINFFEAWIAYVVNEQKDGFDGPTYTYRVNYPEYYCVDTLTITKFERDIPKASNSNERPKSLKYTFIKAFPISITSMPISYEQSSLLKCTVSFCYSRYRIDSKYIPNSSDDYNTQTNQTPTPNQNNQQPNPGGIPSTGNPENPTANIS